VPPWVSCHDFQPLFFLVWRAGGRAKPEKKERFYFGHYTRGGARSSLAPGYFLFVPSGLQCGSLRSPSADVSDGSGQQEPETANRSDPLPSTPRKS
jgi:hypothetical protein